ncbi:putative F-box/kelch-repeat protein-like protein [Tanacetum coccineum]
MKQIIQMRVLCSNLDREDALETVLDVPIPEEMFTSMGSSVALRWQNMATWMKAQTLEKWSSPIIASRYNELNFLLYMVGSPLLPFQIQPGTCSASSIRNSSIEASTAKYITSASKFHQGDESVKARNKEETGGFVLWQKHPNLWSLELLVSGCKVILGSNSKISWRQSSNQLRPMTKGPPRPLRRFLELDTSQSDLEAQANPKYEIIHHTIWGYFSQRSGLLVKFEDSRLLTMNGDNGDGIFWETSTESVIEDYRRKKAELALTWRCPLLSGISRRFTLMFGD